VSRSERDSGQERTSKPSTPSRSPTARATTSHISKNASCKKRCTGTPSRTRSFGANVSPAQKHVLQYNLKTDSDKSRRESLTPSSQLRASDTRTAIARAQPLCGHLPARPAAMPRRSPRAHRGRSLHTQASTRVRQTRRRSATRRPGAVRQRP
jgi:hypothetical protein